MYIHFNWVSVFVSVSVVVFAVNVGVEGIVGGA
jgi:hypothetical protein